MESYLGLHHQENHSRHRWSLHYLLQHCHSPTPQAELALPFVQKNKSIKRKLETKEGFKISKWDNFRCLEHDPQEKNCKKRLNLVLQ